MGVTSTGASFTPPITKSNVSETLAPFPSSAVTLMLTVPMSELAGVPENVRLAASKDSQAGSDPPAASSAV